MRAHIALALVLVGGVAFASSPAIIISPPPSLPLAGGTLSGATTSTAQFKSTVTPTAAGGFTTASAFDTAPFSAVVTSAGAFVPMLAARDTGVTNSGMAIVSASAGRSPYLVGNNSTGSAQMYSEGNAWGMSSSGVLVAQFATAASQIASPLDVRGSIINSGASNGGAVSINDIFLIQLSAAYAGTDCDAAAEVGRVVMHNDGANHISGCLCEQTAAATYAFKAISATGVCP